MFAVRKKKKNFNQNRLSKQKITTCITVCMMIFIKNKMGLIIEKITQILPKDYRVTTTCRYHMQDRHQKQLYDKLHFQIVLGPKNSVLSHII